MGLIELKTGSAESTLDDKGRVNIPVRFREHFQEELIITRGMQRCVWVMTPSVWKHFEKTLNESENVNQEERFALEDKHLNEAQIVELDKAGRIAIPSIFRKYANLKKECTVIRNEGLLVIWDSDVYDAYLAEKDPVAQTAMNKLGSRNIFKAG